MEDPRTLFYVPQDKQIVVYFEWQGPIGTHHFEGFWKNPEGKSVVYSDFSFEAKQARFGAYWTLALAEGTTAGNWSLEAHIDGEQAGNHSFQIVTGPGTVPVTATRHLLSPSDIYKLSMESTVSVEKLNSSGKKIVTSSGFAIGDGRVLTSLAAIDGAVDLGIVLPDGKLMNTKEVVDFNRWQDWVILRVSGLSLKPLVRAKPKSWAVGDRCFFLNVATDGSRTIADSNIVGVSKDKNAGERLSLSYPAALPSHGSPVLNEYGEVIGVLGGNTVPGAESLAGSRMLFSTVFRVLDTTSRATPIDLVREPEQDQSPRLLEWMAQSGWFVPPLEEEEQLVEQASLALGLDNRAGYTPMPQKERYEFTKRDGHFVLFVAWMPARKKRGLVDLRIYDLWNRPRIGSKPTKLNLRGKDITYSSWQIGFSDLQAGIYRLDLVLQEKPVWRTFFKILD